MKKFNNIFEQINVELPAVWKIQTLRTCLLYTSPSPRDA